MKVRHHVSCCASLSLAEAAMAPQLSSSSSSLLFLLLPTDALDGVLSFLSYRDCLSFGETSLSALISTQRELKTRQNRMTQTFVYSKQNSYIGNTKVRAQQSPLLESPCSASEWTPLPTVRDRIEALCRALPTSHPLSHVVLDLLIDIDENIALQDDDDGDDDDDDDDFINTSNDLSASAANTTTISNNKNHQVQQALTLHRKYCRSHKLHAMILSDVIQSNPSSIEHVYCGGGVSGGQKSRLATTTSLRFLTVTLDRYIGDVLCATILMGHSVAGMIEGGPKENDWEHQLECELGIDQIMPGTTASSSSSSSATTSNVAMEDDMDEFGPPVALLRPMNVPVDSWYRVWVYIHSTLLRTAPLSPAHQLHLGMLASPGKDTITAAAAVAVANSTTTMPHRPYMGGDKSALMRKLSLLSNWEPLRVTFNEFGRLGPTFRGRDLIQSHTIFPAGFISSIKYFSHEEVAPATITTITSNGVVDDNDLSAAVANSIQALHLRRWLSGDDAVIQWLLEVHGSVGKARPMTVMPPMACFRSSG